jgi:Kef-type K+ transport system membrane component KefB
MLEVAPWFSAIESQIRLSTVLVIGVVTILPFFAGRLAGRLKLPNLIGYMLIGVLMGPSALNFLTHNILDQLSFITQMVLGFVALNIGLELKFSELQKERFGLMITILAESFGAFLIVFFSLFLLTDNIALSLLFGAIAPASAPAGTVAVIKEYKAKGRLTRALYAVVGFDDGLGIILFGLAASFAKSYVIHPEINDIYSILSTFMFSLKEIGFSIAVGTLSAAIFSIILLRQKYHKTMFVFIFGFVLTVVGICEITHLSLILANMIFGIIITNTQNKEIVKELSKQLYNVLPLFFILFFTLAGAHLNISLVSSLGAIGITYILARTAGLWGGAWLGAKIGKLHDSIRKYLGMGILSQAGVAIGLSLIIVEDFKGLGPLLSNGTHVGDYIGATILNTVTATCLFFEIIGPVLTKIALTKAGEVNQEDNESGDMVLLEQNKRAKAIGPSAVFSQKSRLKSIKNIAHKLELPDFHFEFSNNDTTNISEQNTTTNAYNFFEKYTQAHAIVPKDWNKLRIRDIENIIITKPQYVTLETPINIIIKKITKLKNRHDIDVIDKNRKLVGVISRNSLIKHLFSPDCTSIDTITAEQYRSYDLLNILQNPKDKTAEDIMVKVRTFVDLNTSLIDVAKIFYNNKLEELPLVDDKMVLLGEINLYGIIKQYFKEHSSNKSVIKDPTTT